MENLWMILEDSSLKKDTKTFVFIATSVIGFGILGAILWILIGRFILPEIDWLICFIGYAGVFPGFLGSVLYLYRHESEEEL